jgi:hypothetical protein
MRKWKMNKKKIYLSGAQQFSNDPNGWRDKATKRFDKLNVVSVNPCKFETESPKALQKLHQKNEMDALQKKMVPVVDEDLGELDFCQGCLVFWDDGVVQGAGTIGEITFCRAMGIPVFIVLDTKYEIYDLPWWILGCVRSIKYIYHSFDDFYNSVELKEWLDS